MPPSSCTEEALRSVGPPPITGCWLRTRKKRAIKTSCPGVETTGFLPNVSKTKEIVMDFRKRSGTHTTVCIDAAEVEMVENFKFLGINITNSFSWTIHIEATTKKHSMFIIHPYLHLRK